MIFANRISSSTSCSIWPPETSRPAPLGTSSVTVFKVATLPIIRDYCQFGTRQTSDGRRELKCAPEVEAKFYETARDFDGLGRILRCTAPLLIMFGARGDSLGVVLSGKVAKQIRHGRVIDVRSEEHTS